MDPLWYGTSGPPDADIVIVGEAWGVEEEAAKRPFVGSSGQELFRMLDEAGLYPMKLYNRFVREEKLPAWEARELALKQANILVTNTCAFRPRDNELAYEFLPARDCKGWDINGLHPNDRVKAEVARLHQQILAHPRKLVIAIGNYALWACLDGSTRKEKGQSYTTSDKAKGVRTPGGIMNYRGTMNYYAPILPPEGDIPRTPLLPVIHPAAILRQWALRAVTVHDLRARPPKALSGIEVNWKGKQKNIIAKPSFETAMSVLTPYIKSEVRWLTSDIETARNLITCAGFGFNKDVAIVIPFIQLIEGRFESYWAREQEAKLMEVMRTILLRHKIIGQNYLYDIQWLQRDLGITPNLVWDTMMAQHVLLPGTPKSLLYLSSLYCDHHRFWKDDNVHWEGKGNWLQHLQYNGEDCCRTFEVFEEQRKVIEQTGMMPMMEEQMQLNGLALEMMNTGIRIDLRERARLYHETTEAIGVRNAMLERILPADVAHHTLKTKKAKPWYTSPKQQQWVFGELFGLPLPKHRKTGNTTMNVEALNTLRPKAPYLGLLFDTLEELRSLQVFLSTFINAPLDVDDRMRCLFKPMGTETFRWSSAENVFGTGTNLQNIPKGTED